MLLGREILLVALMTVIANMFLLPVIWYFFGEFSLISVLSNILLSFLSSVFILAVPLFLIFSRLPLIGMALNFIVSFIAEVILFIVKICSRAPLATISLKYSFCTVIVILFAISMCVLLIIKLRHKMLIMIPYGVAVISFVVCFAVYGAFYAKPSVTYANYGENEYFIVSDLGALSVCDNTNGGMSAYDNIKFDLSNTAATEIDKYILTHYHNGHITSLDMLTQRIVVRSFYMPIPTSNDDIKNAEALWSIAKEKGINVVFYENGETLDIINSVKTRIVNSDDHKMGRYISFIGADQSIAYATPAYFYADVETSIAIIGEHGINNNKIYDISGSKAKQIFISSKRLQKNIHIPSLENVYVAKASDAYYKITFLMEQ